MPAKIAENPRARTAADVADNVTASRDEGEQGKFGTAALVSVQVAPEHEAALTLHDPLGTLAATARAYALAARARNTRRAYDADWRHFGAWLRRHGLAPLPPQPKTVGLYLAACASQPSGKSGVVNVATLERRLSGISWHYRTYS